MPRRLLAAGSLLLLAACAAQRPAPAPRAGAPPASTPPPAAPSAVAHLDQHALLLLLADRRIYEPYVVEEALQGSAEVRRHLAAVLGRIPDPRVTPPLALLLRDPGAEVRREAAFALGHRGGEGAVAALLRGTRDPDREVGALAVEALARQQAPLADVVAALAALPAAERWPRLLPALFRFDDPAVVPLAAEGLTLAAPELRARAAYALGRNPRPEGAPPLRGLLADPDPWVRGWAARALGQVGEGADLERIAPLLEDTAEGPVVQALRAAARLIAEGRAAPPAGWQPRLLALLADPRPGVRATALEASGRWLHDPQLSAALLGRWRDGALRERELALLALAEGRDPRASDVLAEAVRSPDPVLRAAAARAAGLLEQPHHLETLAADAERRVRVAALQVLLEGSAGEEGLPRARQGLGDSDPMVRAAALEWLAEHPLEPPATLLAALDGAWDDASDDARIAAVRALAARAGAVAAERGAVSTALADLLGHPDYLLRRAVGDALRELGQEPPPLGAAGRPLAVEVYREVVLRTREPRRVEMVTEGGIVVLSLDCPRAPMTCLNFLQLAEQGFYDGLAWHRVVADFVVQGGDPRGDGYGGPGYALRDELNRLRYDRGVLGMALSGPDTGGSQFFVTLSPQPHLDGGYTAFGRVESGMEVLDRTLQWERILRVREL